MEEEEHGRKAQLRQRHGNINNQRKGQTASIISKSREDGRNNRLLQSIFVRSMARHADHCAWKFLNGVA